MPDSLDLLTVPEAAAALRIKVSTLRAWILNRKIRFHKVGGKILFKRVELSRFVDKSTVPEGVK